MTTKINKDTLKDTLIKQGWSLDAWGHLKKVAAGRCYRVCFKPRVVRLECKVTHEATEYSEARSEWRSITSVGYKDCCITDEGCVTLGKVKLKAS